MAIVEETIEPGGERYGRTRGGRWVPMRRLVPAPPTSLRGVELDGALDVGWIVEERAAVYERPESSARPVELRVRFDQVRVLPGAPPGWVRIDGQRFLRAASVRQPRAAPRPPGVGAGERWIDVDRTSQTLVAYEGDRPRFAALVSTGTDQHATPAGRRRIHSKLRAADMSNLEQATEGGHYFVEAVPWVQYFGPGLALHGAFWHQRFGHPRSHGCVNLAPGDARWLFRFTAPVLPPAEDAVHGDGTLVQVR